MPQLTEAELKLQRKKEELRKKKEQQKLKEEQAAKVSERSAAPAAAPQSALEKAKAALAKKAAAAAAEGTAAGKAAAADPLATAKQALEAKRRQSAGQKRPSIRKQPLANGSKSKAEPTSKPNASLEASPGGHAGPSSADGQEGGKRSGGAVAGPSDAWDWDQQDMKRRRTEPPTSSGNDDPGRRRDETVFVGDLPPFFTHQAVLELFSQFAPVSHVSLYREQCFAFVRFGNVADAQAVLARFREQPLSTHGFALRVNQAYGRILDQGVAPEDLGEYGDVRRGGMHPKVQEARRQGDRLAAELVRAGAHGLDFSVGPQPRELITYDDL